MDLCVVVRHYKENFRARAGEELQSFRAVSSLEVAVRRAALAMTSEGKRYSHQRRLKEVNLQRAEAKLIGRIAEIEQAKRFALLFELVKRSVGHLEGLGELYVYDTALRIAAKRGALPERVYLHAGARLGAKALKLDVDGVIGFFRSELPQALQELEPHEIEDVLCIYKRYFTGEVAELADKTACWTDDDLGKEDELPTVRPAC